MRMAMLSRFVLESYAGLSALECLWHANPGAVSGTPADSALQSFGCFRTDGLDLDALAGDGAKGHDRDMAHVAFSSRPLTLRVSWYAGPNPQAGRAHLG
eukprot:scaffold556138_cov48-Prasinocladus_malaysianus.AAC.1